MATFKPCVQKMRSDGFYPVYIRVTHSRKVGYIKTDMMVQKKDISKSKDIRDNYVLKNCTNLIAEYTLKLNSNQIDNWTVQEVITFLTTDQSDVCFSDYARQFIGKLINGGHDRSAKNFKMALQHLERYIGSNKLMFSQLTSVILNKWIESMENTARAKEQYPGLLRQIHRQGMLEFNDEERNVIRIKFNPWMRVKVPSADVPEKKAISAEACREFFHRPLPETKMISSLPELGRDVAMLVMCLGGINTVDLYQMKKSNYQNGVLCYNRSKTKNSRPDEAYFEMKVEPFIQSVFDKYLTPDDDEYLFSFHTRYSNFDSFCVNVNNGIKKICKDMGMPKQEWYSVYTFRHTWGTIAQNDCDANLYEVAFGMNHSQGMKVTRGYVRLDFTPAWTLNAKVIEFIFFSNEKSKQSIAKDTEKKPEPQFRITPKKLIYARAYFKGEVLAEITDIGFSNIDSVIGALVSKLPSDIPNGCSVHFRIEDCDAKREMVYERTKGKGF